MTDIATGSKKIPTTYLPADWAKTAASHFGCSENKIERVVYGSAAATKGNLEIFDYMLKMAEDGKVAFDEAEKERQQRLEALNQ